MEGQTSATDSQAYVLPVLLPVARLKPSARNANPCCRYTMRNTAGVLPPTVCFHLLLACCLISSKHFILGTPRLCVITGGWFLPLFAELAADARTPSAAPLAEPWTSREPQHCGLKSISVWNPSVKRATWKEHYFKVSVKCNPHYF